MAGRDFVGRRRLTLQDLGNLGEALGAVAVIVSLIYLALQIRQNTTTESLFSSWNANQSGLHSAM